jgi:hypothetical protein
VVPLGAIPTIAAVETVCPLPSLNVIVELPAESPPTVNVADPPTAVAESGETAAVPPVTAAVIVPVKPVSETVTCESAPAATESELGLAMSCGEALALDEAEAVAEAEADAVAEADADGLGVGVSAVV